MTIAARLVRESRKIKQNSACATVVHHCNHEHLGRFHNFVCFISKVGSKLGSKNSPKVFTAETSERIAILSLVSAVNTFVNTFENFFKFQVLLYILIMRKSTSARLKIMEDPTSMRWKRTIVRLRTTALKEFRH